MLLLLPSIHWLLSLHEQDVATDALIVVIQNVIANTFIPVGQQQQQQWKAAARGNKAKQANQSECEKGNNNKH